MNGKLQNKLTFSVFGPSIHCMHIFIVNILMNKHLIIRITLDIPLLITQALSRVQVS